ncbi:LuxR C-terminal-related transcriptional regulator [Aquipuribacter nitratireducens]|uniref:LuxR C-terminal-related transcriptional regulator n=1 Tax=Aquipuribacter nitratireducens TaxID=650104 RepID=A0ABW0GL98_9MICO
MPVPVLETKLFAPRRRRSLVPRPGAHDLLTSAVRAEHPLVLVAAPAGFGKTTTVAAWLAALTDSDVDVRTAWLSLDAGDDDPIRFLAHVAATMRRVGLDAGDLATLAAEGSPVQAAAQLVNTVAVEGARTPQRRWVLVLDDYHLVGAAAVHDVVTHLLEHPPPRLHIVVSTRADPPFPLSRLRSRGEMTELRTADLRLTAAEAYDFLHRVMGTPVTPEQSVALTQRTEGWAAGLQLAALSVRGAAETEVDRFVRSFTGSDRFVVDYLLDEVLAKESPDRRELLLLTSVADRLTGSLCDAITGQRTGARTLEQLERDNVFVVPLDTTRTWYRYHHLFAEVLRARLRSDHADLVPGLHRRAGEWFASHGHLPDAVGHALAAGDHVRAARLVELALPEVRRTRQDGLLLQWLAALPRDVVRGNPVLSMFAGWAAMVAGDLDLVARRLDEADEALAAGARDRDVAASWAATDELLAAPATLEVFRASLAQARGDVTGTAHHARLALDLCRSDDHLVRGAASGFVALAAWAEGDARTGLAMFAQAVDSLRAAGNLVDALDGTLVLADIEVAAGRAAPARARLEAALRVATDGSVPGARTAPDLHVALAALALRDGDLDAADSHLASAATLRTQTPRTEARHRFAQVSAEVRAARGDHASALRLLDEAATAYRAGFHPDVHPVAASRVRVLLAAGDLGAAAAVVAARGVTLADDPVHLRLRDHLALVAFHLARARAGLDADLPAAAALLSRLHETAVADGRHGDAREVRDLQDLLGSPPARDGAPDDRSSRDQRDGGLPEPLSARELDVLRLLRGELSGPEIARTLHVSLNTLRTHTRRIYTKLGVSSRAAAVRRAHEVGLLRRPPTPGRTDHQADHQQDHHMW